MNLRMLIGVAVFSVMSGVAGTAHAQETVLSGTTTDATDAVLPGVTVTALHVESGNTFVAVTDATGRYRIGALRTGAYKITAELAGFSSVSREGVELLLGQRPVINFKLTLSTVQESVTVTGATPLLDMTQSKLGGSIDPLQMRELPINGRNWMDLSMLAPGSRINAIGTNDPLTVRTGQGMQFQLNLDGQQVTYMLSGGGAQPGFSRDAIGEFEFISSRSDATQGRSSGVQVNAITKDGTNRYTGSVSGFFRDDSFNAEDFIVERVLPYSNQQLVWTFGGPIRTDRMHFFANYEYEREAQTVTLTSPFPIFNAVNVSGTRTEYKTGLRVDTQISASTRLMVRGNRFDQLYPVAPSQTGLGGATIHPSSVYSTETVTNAVFATLTQVVGPRVLNEIKVGYSTIANPFKVTEPGLLGVPRIVLRAYTLGNSPTVPQDIGQRNTIIRDDLSFLLRGGGYHDFQVGGEFMYNMTYFNEFPFARDGLLIAAGGPIPSNVEDLFPVWKRLVDVELGGAFAHCAVSRPRASAPIASTTQGTSVLPGCKITGR